MTTAHTTHQSPDSSGEYEDAASWEHIEYSTITTNQPAAVDPLSDAFARLDIGVDTERPNQPAITKTDTIASGFSNRDGSYHPLVTPTIFITPPETAGASMPKP